MSVSCGFSVDAEAERDIGAVIAFELEAAQVRTVVQGTD